MGFEELTHTVAIWLTIFYMLAATSWIGRSIIIVGWDVWIPLAGISILVGITMISTYHFEPTETFGSSKIDHDQRKMLRIMVSVFILMFALIPFAYVYSSPTPLADFLLLTLMSYVWLTYVAILIISVIFYERINGMIKNE